MASVTAGGKPASPVWQLNLRATTSTGKPRVILQLHIDPILTAYRTVLYGDAEEMPSPMQLLKELDVTGTINY